MNAWIGGLVVAPLAFAATELLAIVVHRQFMHGAGWGWHRSHHEPRRDDDGYFERNDWYAVVFSLGAALLFVWAGVVGSGLLWWVGAGITAYGLAYAVVHDGLVHGRLPGLRWTGRQGGYLGRLVEAHRLHHAVRERDDGVSFGFLWAPPVESLRAQLRARTAARHAAARTARPEGAAATVGAERSGAGRGQGA